MDIRKELKDIVCHLCGKPIYEGEKTTSEIIRGWHYHDKCLKKNKDKYTRQGKEKLK